MFHGVYNNGVKSINKGVIYVRTMTKVKVDGFSIAGTPAGSGGSSSLPVATNETLGGVKIGSGLSVTSDGTISVSSGMTLLNTITADGVKTFGQLFSELLQGINFSLSKFYVLTRDNDQFSSVCVLDNQRIVLSRSERTGSGAFTEVVSYHKTDSNYNWYYVGSSSGSKWNDTSTNGVVFSIYEL